MTPYRPIYTIQTVMTFCVQELFLPLPYRTRRQADINMLNRYSHRSIQQLDREILKAAGIEPPPEPGMDKLTETKFCPRCLNTNNPPEANCCIRCGNPLSAQAIRQHQAVEVIKAGPLTEIFKDPERKEEIMQGIYQLILESERKKKSGERSA